MDIKKLAQTLHPYERKVLPYLNKAKTLKELAKLSGMQEIQVMRALQWLQNKEIINLKTNVKNIIQLDKNGKYYLKYNLPEKRFLMVVKDKDLGLKEIKKQAKLKDSELNACIGLLKKNLAIEIKKGMKISLTDQGKKLLNKETLEEKFLKSISVNGKQVSSLEPEEKLAFKNLMKRKDIIKKIEQKIKEISLTKKGKKLINIKIDTNVIDSITPKMLKHGTWKNKNFRRYDVKINVPKIYGGKRHFVNQALDYARRIWLEMGFEEMQGPIVNTSFWNFDALFTAQDHPVRELQDTFFVDSKGKLPDKRMVDKVKKQHEQSWKYKWNPEDAKKVVLRTHTTVLSARTLAKIKENLEKNIPSKFFAIGKCFRNEAVDWSHLFEFNQTEGIVVDENANFRHLLGYLKNFFKKMGYEKARFRPAYFPYTEPSVEIDVYHEGRQKWIELGGAGILRPEVVIPLLGKDVPVLAWGPGIDRILMDYYNIKDLRDLYKNNLKQIREMKSWMK